jgi:hypothetical protein
MRDKTNLQRKTKTNTNKQQDQDQNQDQDQRPRPRPDQDLDQEKKNQDRGRAHKLTKLLKMAKNLASPWIVLAWKQTNLETNKQAWKQQKSFWKDKKNKKRTDVELLLPWQTIELIENL